LVFPDYSGQVLPAIVAVVENVLLRAGRRKLADDDDFGIRAVLPEAPGEVVNHERALGNSDAPDHPDPDGSSRRRPVRDRGKIGSGA